MRRERWQPLGWPTGGGSVPRKTPRKHTLLANVANAPTLPAPEFANL